MDKNSVKNSDSKQLKTNSKQKHQRLPMAHAQTKLGNIFYRLLNEIRQNICLLYLTEEITKELCNNIINSTAL